MRAQPPRLRTAPGAHPRTHPCLPADSGRLHGRPSRVHCAPEVRCERSGCCLGAGQGAQRRCCGVPRCRRSQLGRPPTAPHPLPPPAAFTCSVGDWDSLADDLVNLGFVDDVRCRWAAAGCCCCTSLPSRCLACALFTASPCCCSRLRRAGGRQVAAGGAAGRHPHAADRGRRRQEGAWLLAVLLPALLAGVLLGSRNHHVLTPLPCCDAPAGQHPSGDGGD